MKQTHIITPLVRINDSSCLHLKITVEQCCKFEGKFGLACSLNEAKKTPTHPHPLLPPGLSLRSVGLGRVVGFLVMDDSRTESLFPGRALNFHVKHTDILWGWEVHTHTHALLTHTLTLYTWPTFICTDTLTPYIHCGQTDLTFLTYVHLL